MQHFVQICPALITAAKKWTRLCIVSGESNAFDEIVSNEIEAAVAFNEAAGALIDTFVILRSYLT